MGMPLEPGTRIGPYEILRLAGAGGMGEVYQARDSRLRRTVALKIASPAVNADAQVRARFQREARAIAALNHPHICAIHDVASLAGCEVIVMEYLEGETLEQRLRRGPIPTAELLPIATAIVDALSEAHRHGIVHRDLRPSNVMLTRSGVKLLDFGIAKQREVLGLDSAPSTNATETAFGTIEGVLIGTVPTNADDVTDALRDLRVAIRKENTSAAWHREEQVVAENPDLIVAHLSCLLDARLGEGQPELAEHLLDLAASRFIVFLAYVAARNPRTRFIVYSRGVFQTQGGEQEWVAAQVARLPVLKGRLNAFIVPGGRERASFREPRTAQLLRTRVADVLGLARR
jgi:serine/threonine protein kinase